MDRSERQAVLDRLHREQFEVPAAMNRKMEVALDVLLDPYRVRAGVIELSGEQAADLEGKRAAVKALFDERMQEFRHGFDAAFDVARLSRAA